MVGEITSNHAEHNRYRDRKGPHPGILLGIVHGATTLPLLILATTLTVSFTMDSGT